MSVIHPTLWWPWQVLSQLRSGSVRQGEEEVQRSAAEVEAALERLCQVADFKDVARRQQ